MALAVATSGCATRAEFVHPGFSRFDVQRIGIYDIENSTVFDLKAVSFGGAFQRAVFGVSEHDIHSLLHGAIEAALLRKSYETLSLGPAPKADTGSSLPPDVGKVHDAELSCRIVFWSAESGSRPEMDLRFQVEIYSAAEREKLYVGTFKAVMRDTARTRTLQRLDTVIRPAVIRAFSDLPPAAVK